VGGAARAGTEAWAREGREAFTGPAWEDRRFTRGSIRRMKASHRALGGRALETWVALVRRRAVAPGLLTPAVIYRTLGEQNVQWAIRRHGPPWWRRFVARRGVEALAPFLRRRRGAYAWDRTTAAGTPVPLDEALRSPASRARRALVWRWHQDTRLAAKPKIPRDPYVAWDGRAAVQARKTAWKAAKQAQEAAAAARKARPRGADTGEGSGSKA